MSIATVEIRSFSGPDLVELGSANRPAIVRLNVGPKGDDGATGPAGPNSVTSATTSDGTCDLALNTLKVGEDLTTSGLHSVAIGLECEASGDFSVAIGNQTAASAEYSFATGTNTVASGIASFAGGESTTASGGAAFAIGFTTTASGAFSFAGGINSVASGEGAYAFGVRAKAIHAGASVESDTQDADAESTATDEKTFRFANGYRFLGGSASFSGAVTASNLSGTNTGDQDLSGLVAKSAYTPAHSILVQQSGTGSPTAVTLGNNTILGRMSGGGSNIAGLSASDARTVMGLGTLATVNGGTGVADFLASPTSANLAAAVTGETGSGSLVFATSPTLTTPTISVMNLGGATSAFPSLRPAPTLIGLVGAQLNQADNGADCYLRAVIIATYNNSLNFSINAANAANNATRVSINKNDAGTVQMDGNGVCAWGQANSDQRTLTPDTGLSRSAAGVVAVGTGAQGSRAGTLLATRAGLGVASINAASLLELSSTTQGFLPPRMTTAQRDAITSVPAGLMIYNTSTNKLNFFNGTAWEVVTSA